tara:strand:+ start:868 stop:1587 length:720 start_codon:yes stop_codon:yes gene_type:complete
MKVKVISPVVNFPKFLEIQILKFRENLLCDFELICIDDSKSDDQREQFQKICSEHDDVSTWYRNTNAPVSGPSMGHANAIQFALDNIVYTSCLDDIVFLIDSDIFLMEKINLLEFMKDKEIASFMQSRGDVDYLWPGFTLLNMPLLKMYESEIKFFPGSFGGQMCDTGGQSHNFLMENNIKPYSVDCKFEGEYKNENLVNMETFMHGKFLHFRGGTIWDGKVDVFRQKIEILNNILAHG